MGVHYYRQQHPPYRHHNHWIGLNFQFSVRRGMPNEVCDDTQNEVCDDHLMILTNQQYPTMDTNPASPQNPTATSWIERSRATVGRRFGKRRCAVARKLRHPRLSVHLHRLPRLSSLELCKFVPLHFDMVVPTK
mmetsp:Transcript_15016/g.22011  ORF Transcript_15016/g.22011 Transcript_15016/m.22011 type:complete len:134 (-) Transcript_15016:219-620(-)